MFSHLFKSCSCCRTLKDSQVEISEASPLSPLHLRTPAFVWGVCLTMAILVVLIEFACFSKKKDKKSTKVGDVEMKKLQLMNYMYLTIC